MYDFHVRTTKDGTRWNIRIIIVFAHFVCKRQEKVLVWIKNIIIYI